jgi:hypothetical protein
MRRAQESLLVAATVVLLSGCNRGPSLPEQPSDDPSARTTTLVNPVDTPEELAKRCDLPIYPGAKAPDGMSRMPRKDPGGGTAYDLVLTTHDDKSRVTSFYSKVLKKPALRSKEGNQIMGRTPKKNDAIVTVTSDGGETMIRINAISYLR